MAEDSPVAKYFDLLEKAMNAAGRPGYTGAQLEKFLLDAGFVDVVVTSFKQPMGPWPKKKNLKMAGGLALASNETVCGEILMTRVVLIYPGFPCVRIGGVHQDFGDGR